MWGFRYRFLQYQLENVQIACPLWTTASLRKRNLITISECPVCTCRGVCKLLTSIRLIQVRAIKLQVVLNAQSTASQGLSPTGCSLAGVPKQF